MPFVGEESDVLWIQLYGFITRQGPSPPSTVLLMQTCFVGEESDVLWVQLYGSIITRQGSLKVLLLVRSIAFLLFLHRLK